MVYILWNLPCEVVASKLCHTTCIAKVADIFAILAGSRHRWALLLGYPADIAIRYSLVVADTSPDLFLYLLLVVRIWLSCCPCVHSSIYTPYFSGMSELVVTIETYHQVYVKRAPYVYASSNHGQRLDGSTTHLAFPRLVRGRRSSPLL